MAKYPKAIVIGTSSIALYCLKSLSKLTDIAEIQYIQYGSHQFNSIIDNYCKASNIEAHKVSHSKALTRILNAIKEPTLVVSANNTYIFPKIVIENRNLRIINFHNGLTNVHRGMNSPMWSIFLLDKIAGCVWHEVNEFLDDGDVIDYRTVELDTNTTAMKLTKKLIELGKDMFETVLDKVMNHSSIEYKKLGKNKYVTHKNSDLPNNGYLDINWSLVQISAFLRSMDYGPMGNVFPRPCIRLYDKDYLIKSYSQDLSHDNKSVECIFLYFSSESNMVEIKITSKSLKYKEV